jgi:hypothetical protein
MMKMMKVGTWKNRAKSHGGKGLSKENREWFLSFFLEREKMKDDFMWLWVVYLFHQQRSLNFCCLFPCVWAITFGLETTIKGSFYGEVSFMTSLVKFA